MWFRSLIRKLRVKHLNDPQRVLEDVYPDDIILVGYPKSGNTWLRFLIGNYLTGNECDFLNIHSIVPGIDEDPGVCKGLSSPRFMHTHVSYQDFMNIHEAFDHEIPKVVFLVRDGRDVAVSYYHHLIKHFEIDKDTSFGKFLERFMQAEFNPFQSWGEYVNVWIDTLSINESRRLIVRYADLRANAERELARILQFSGLVADIEIVKGSVQMSSFENVKMLEEVQQEAHYRLKYSDKSIRFLRSGRQGQWERYFSPEMTEKFLEINRDALVNLGYIT